MLAAIIWAAALVLGLGGTASAATIQVTTSADENGAGADCSLREAVTAANTNAAFGGCAAGDPNGTATDRITFAAGTNGNAIVLGGTEIAISSNLDIVGNGVAQTQVSGNNVSRVLNVTTGTVSISDLTVRNGRTAGLSGPGILNAGALTIVNGAISGNVTTAGSGAGISSSGSLTIRNTTVSGNSASGSGGGILNTGSLTVSDSAITGNQAGAFGGGIINLGALSMTNSTVTGNSGGGEGGGIYAQSGALITGSTINGNTAGSRGGGMRISAGVTIVSQSTISANTAALEGGGVQLSAGDVSLIHTTVSGNSAPTGGGVRRQSGTASLRASMLDSGASGDNCVGTLVSLGSNLSDDGSCAAAFNQTGDANNVGLLLGPLADNGGPTWTHRLLDGSPAIDAVQGACTTDGTGGGIAVSVDQRGQPRPSGVRCDAGAFERQSGRLQFGVSTFAGSETAGTAAITVTRTGGAEGGVGATILPSNGTAFAPADFNAAALTVAFADGQSSAIVQLPVTDDDQNEPPEAINLALSSPTGGATLGAQITATVSITDNDAGAGVNPNSSPTPGDDSGSGTGKQKDTDTQKPPSQLQQQQQQRTNQSNLDQYHTEGNVAAVEPLADGRGLLITIALGRGETLEIVFRCSPPDCPTLRPGDYITVEGEQGGREERGRFIADQVEASRRR